MTERRATWHHGWTHGGRRRWDLPPNVTKVLIAWAVLGPSILAYLQGRP